MSIKKTIRDTQATLEKLGYSTVYGADGIWGSASEKAFQAMIADKYPKGLISWGQKITPEDIKALEKLIKDMDIKAHVNDFMACMAFESGGTFDPATQNKSTKATGPLQIMPKNAIAYGTTVEALSKMTFQEYLKYVGIHFKPYARRIQNTGDVYMSILWPRAVGHPDNYVLWSLGTTAFRQNSGLDLNKDGTITKGEALHFIKNRLVRGFLPELVRQM